MADDRSWRVAYAVKELHRSTVITSDGPQQIEREVEVEYLSGAMTIDEATALVQKIRRTTPNLVYAWVK